jgi:hypothetical protein
MGIRNRDYMKQPSDDDGQNATPPNSKAEEFARRLLQNRHRLFLCMGVGLVIVAIIAAIIAKLSEH